MQLDGESREAATGAVCDSGITTAEIEVPVHQIVNQPENALLSEQRN